MIIRNYFAAANGYTGFRSYFDTVFKSEDFEHIFVLKGGPGTGKNTLMRRICDKATLHGYDHDRILCSSDPKSLDGVIVYTVHGRFAIIDGTAPHERDAIIPGAIDTIINLGEGFDRNLLTTAKREILELSAKKKFAYKKAYDSLRAAGSINSVIMDRIARAFSYDKADSVLKDIIDTATVSRNSRIALINAFCKHGKLHLDSYCENDKVVEILGDHGEELIFMNYFREKIKQKVNLISFDPLDTRFCDAITLGKTRFEATRMRTGKNASIATDNLISGFVDASELDMLERTRDDILLQAQTHLEVASALHFELESIYTSAMHFEKNDEFLQKISANIF